MYLYLVSKENPTLTAVQTAKKITEFWKQLSSHERGFYRDVAHKEENEHQAYKKDETKGEVKKIVSDGNKSRLLQLFEKMKNSKNEKKEKLNMRTIVPWTIDRTKIITRLNFIIDIHKLFIIYIFSLLIYFNNHFID